MDRDEWLRSRYPRSLLLLYFNIPNHYHGFVNGKGQKEGFAHWNLSYLFSDMSSPAPALKAPKRRAPNLGLCLPSLTDRKAKGSSHPSNDDES
jgi:hypothetical protein